MVETELLRLAAIRDRIEAERDTVTEQLRAVAIGARRKGWSAQRIAETIGVSKRTVQVWTDRYK